jgi:hypothetical protein
MRVEDFQHLEYVLEEFRKAIKRGTQHFSFPVCQSSRLVRVRPLSDAASCVPAGVNLLDAEELKRVSDFILIYVVQQ